MKPASQVTPATQDHERAVASLVSFAEVACGERETFVVRATPSRRQTDAIVGATLADAESIGWKLTLRKRIADGAAWEGTWHGDRAYVLALYHPDWAALVFCRPTDAPR